MGFSLFSLGNGLAITGLVLAALGYAQGGVGGWIVALVAVGELTILSSVLFLGDDGYQRLEARTSTLLRREPAMTVKSVTPRRHGVGMALLILHLSAYFVVWTVCVLGYTKATNEDPFPSVFGLAFEQQGSALVWGVIAAELLFAMAIYVLGPAWWGHFKQLFRYQPAAAPQVPEAPRALPTLRYRVGLGVFVVGNVLATVGLFLPVFGFAKGRMVGVIALIMGAGEVISLSSIFLLGKEGFKELKTRLFAVLKRTPSGAPISRQRHRLGATLLALHVVTQFGAVALPIASHYGAIAEGRFPTILGLDHPEQLKWFLGLLIASELLFFAGVYTLGEDWWGRFRALFHLKGSDAE